MSTVMVCDRCGKQGVDRGWSRVSVIHFHVGRSGGVTTKDVDGVATRDLCGACSNDLDRFLGGVRLHRAARGADREA